MSYIGMMMKQSRYRIAWRIPETQLEPGPIEETIGPSGQIEDYEKMAIKWFNDVSTKITTEWEFYYSEEEL